MINRIKLIQNLLLEALELKDADKQSAFLAEACGPDLALREELEELIQAEAAAGQTLPGEPFVAAPRASLRRALETLTAPGEAPSAVVTEKPGDRIGRYKLLQKIGEGGCGVVYVAEQEEPVRRQVALKVIKLGMDTRQVVARFEAERQALALMDHPNIAKVLDAGATESGRPYFVMEFVRGHKITRYCDEQRFSTRQRLDLYIQVCQAVQHAHQKGIIHRDLKPSNILVTERDGRPVPKVIDFGIAKATGDLQLTDKTLFTAFEQFIGTPAYMSPEQANLSGLDIDTRSDIYSLGVLLYELLTSQTPFETKRLLEAGLDEVRRIIREEEPVRPSNRLHTLDEAEQTTVATRRQSEPRELFHILRGDLDWIVMKALEKDRARRYETATTLAADIQRSLNNEPILARPPTLGYRTTKLLRKHRLAVIAAGALVVLLLSGLGFALIMLRNEARAHRLAELESHKSKQVTSFLMDMFASLTLEEYRKMDMSIVIALADRAALRLKDDLRGEPEADADLRATLGRVFLAVGEYDKARSMLEDAWKTRATLFGSNSLPTAKCMLQLAYLMVLKEQAAIAPNTNVYHQAKALAGAALVITQRHLGQEHLDVAECLRVLGIIEQRMQNINEARVAFKSAFEILKKSSASPAGWELVNLAMLSASIEEKAGNLTESEKWYRQAMDYATKPGQEVFLYACARAAAKELEEQTNLLAAEHVLTETLFRLQQSADSGTPMVTRCSIQMWTFVGNLRVEQTNLIAAIEAYSSAFHLSETNGDIFNPLYLPNVTRLLGKKASVYKALKSFGEAEATLLKADQMVGDSFKPLPELATDIASQLAELYSTWDKPDEAAKWTQKVAELKSQKQHQEAKPRTPKL